MSGAPLPRTAAFSPSSISRLTRDADHFQAEWERCSSLPGAGAGPGPGWLPVGACCSFLPSTPQMGSQPRAEWGSPGLTSDPPPNPSWPLPSALLPSPPTPTSCPSLKAQPRAWSLGGMPARLTSPRPHLLTGKSGQRCFLHRLQGDRGGCHVASWGPRGDRLSAALGTNERRKEGRKGLES